MNEHPDPQGRRFRCRHWSMEEERCRLHMRSCEECFLFDRMNDSEYRARARRWGLKVQELLFEEGPKGAAGNNA